MKIVEEEADEPDDSQEAGHEGCEVFRMEVGDIFKTLDERALDLMAKSSILQQTKFVVVLRLWNYPSSCHRLDRRCGLVLLDRMWSQATTQTSSIWTAQPQLLSSLRHPLGGLRCWAEACDGAFNVDNFNFLAIVKSEVK